MEQSQAFSDLKAMVTACEAVNTALAATPFDAVDLQRALVSVADQLALCLTINDVVPTVTRYTIIWTADDKISINGYLKYLLKRIVTAIVHKPDSQDAPVSVPVICLTEQVQAVGADSDSANMNQTVAQDIKWSPCSHPLAVQSMLLALRPKYYLKYCTIIDLLRGNASSNDPTSITLDSVISKDFQWLPVYIVAHCLSMYLYPDQFYNHKPDLQILGECFGLELPDSFYETHAPLCDTKILCAMKSRPVNDRLKLYYRRVSGGHDPAWFANTNLLTLDDVTLYAKLVACADYENAIECCYHKLFTFIIAYCHQGSVSSHTLQRLQHIFDGKIRVNVHNLDSDLMRKVWYTFAKYLTPSSAEQISSSLSYAFNEKTRLPILLMVKDAIKAYPDFSWVKLVAADGQGWSKYTKAEEIVGNNLFYGYGRMSPDVAAANYVTFAYAALLLFKDVGGKRSLEHYLGLSNGPIPYRALVELLVNDYKRCRLAKPPILRQNPTWLH